MDKRIKILFEDADILVCEKPAGLAVQSAKLSEPDMESELKKYLAAGARRSGIAMPKPAGTQHSPAGQKNTAVGEKTPIYLGIVHRLDQPVSGVMVFARNRKAAAALSAQAADRRMEKTYRAVVLWKGGDSSAAVPLTDYLISLPDGGARIVAPSEQGAKRAELSYRVLERQEDRALLEIALKTGRHHQIRVQMAHAGHPLLGDLRYGTKESLELSNSLGIRNIQLQAVRLSFLHPGTGRRVYYEMEPKLGL